MATIVSDESGIKRLIQEAIDDCLTVRLPALIREATRREWLTKDDLKDLTGWSDRTIQHLRDSSQIPFMQHGRKILYPTDGIERFLRDNLILPQNR